MTYEFTDQETKILREALHARVAQMESELVHTDSRDFRRELRAYMEGVEALLHKLTFRTEAQSTYA